MEKEDDKVDLVDNEEQPATQDSAIHVEEVVLNNTLGDNAVNNTTQYTHGNSTQDIIKINQREEPSLAPKPIAEANGNVNSSSDHVGNGTTLTQTADDNQVIVCGGALGAYPVLYATPGSTRVVQNQQSQRTGEGRVTIATPNNADNPDEERPIRAKDLKPLKIFSVVATILFPPTGIAALVVALQTEKEFWKGCDQGDMTIAKKKCKLCERLIIFSIVFGLIMYVMVLAIMERNMMLNNDSYAQRKLGLLHP